MISGLTTEQWVEKARNTHGGKYNYSKVVYKNSKKNIIIGCNIHGYFNQAPNAHISGYGCPACGRLLAGKANRSNTNEFIQKAKVLHGNKYDYSKVKYKTNSSSVIISCKIHGDFMQRPQHHLAARGCPKCSRLQKKLDYTTEWIKKAKEIHKGKYTYNNARYTGAGNKIAIVCRIHGEFKQRSAAHLQGAGCPACGVNANAITRTDDVHDFIIKSRKVHGNKYDYSKSVYKTSKDKIVITCYEHGDFEQEVNGHIQGSGCPVCADLSTGYRLRSNKKEFVKKAAKVHKKKYDYSKAVYTRNSDKVVITCPTPW